MPSKPLPILIGGHSDAALTRAAAIGDGWMHAGGSEEELLKLLARLTDLRREHGTRGDFEVHVLSMSAYSLDGIKRLTDLGVTDVVVGFRKGYEPDTMPLETKIAAIKRYADKIIAKA